MGTAVVPVHPCHPIAPSTAEDIHQIPGGHAVPVIRSHIIVSLEFPIPILFHGNGQINRQRLQHQLVGPGGMGVPYNDIFAGSSRPYTVRDNPVIGKIPSANHITGPRRGHSAPSVPQKRLLIAMGHQFRAGFTIGIRIIPIQGITFPVTILPFPVLIHLIRGHI